MITPHHIYLVAISRSSLDLQSLAHLSLSSSRSRMMVSPRRLILLKALSGVRLTYPREVISSSWLSVSLKEEIGMTEVTVSDMPMGSICGSGTPLAVRAARGIWKARLQYAMPLKCKQHQW